MKEGFDGNFSDADQTLYGRVFSLYTIIIGLLLFSYSLVANIRNKPAYGVHIIKSSSWIGASKCLGT